MSDACQSNDRELPHDLGRLRHFNVIVTMLDRTLPDRPYRLLGDWINGHLSWSECLEQIKAPFPVAVQHMSYDQMGHAERVYDAKVELEQQIGDSTLSIQFGRVGEFRTQVTQVKIWWSEMGQWYSSAMDNLPDDYWYKKPLP